MPPRSNSTLYKPGGSDNSTLPSPRPHTVRCVSWTVISTVGSEVTKNPVSAWPWSTRSEDDTRHRLSTVVERERATGRVLQLVQACVESHLPGLHAGIAL